MKYVSTRGHSASQSFTDILLEGLAPDGGLMVPEQWPRIMPVKFQAMRDLAYPQLAFEILRFFAADYPGAELKRLLKNTDTKKAPDYEQTRTAPGNTGFRTGNGAQTQFYF